MSQSEKRLSSIRWLVAEPLVVSIIALNLLALFLDAFPAVNRRYGTLLHLIDYLCIVYFVIEAVLKHLLLGVKGYWSRPWNRFDFVVVMASTPLLLEPFVNQAHTFALIPLLRMGRFLRFVRVLRFVPNSDQIWSGVVRSLKAAVSVFLVLFMLNLILAIGATMLFRDLPISKQYFDDPLTSFYTLFKVFTVEGWYEIPDALAESEVSYFWVVTVRMYFIFSVLVGGILGLSLANAVFVDEMTLDNNDELEELVRELQLQLLEFREEVRSSFQNRTNET